MPEPRIFIMEPPRTPLGRALAFLGIVAAVVASFFIGVFVLAVALGVWVLLTLYRLLLGRSRPRRGSGGPGGPAGPSGQTGGDAEQGPRTYEGVAHVVEDGAEEKEQDRDERS